MNRIIPTPSLERLCAMYHILEALEQNSQKTISSIELGKRLGINSNSVRKDISFLGEIGNCRAGYDVQKLKEHITVHLRINRKRTACVVGLGRLGTAILNYERLSKGDFIIVAGFDTNINKIETIQTHVPLYPANEIPIVVKREKIELAILAVPDFAAEESARRLIEGGIKGIVNFSPAIIKPLGDVRIRNIDLITEFRILSVISTLMNGQQRLY